MTTILSSTGAMFLCFGYLGGNELLMWFGVMHILFAFMSLFRG